MSVGELLENSVDVCDQSAADSFTDVQLLFRAYLMPITYLFGIVANAINVIVFSRKCMRSQPVNWFFLVLSLSDLCVLIASFFVFSVPVYAELANNIGIARASAMLIVWFYPMAQTGLTMSVYLTILVSVHRYLGVCHPFLIRRISNSMAVKCVIATALVFAFLFNTSRWFELTVMACYSKEHDRESLVVIPTDLMVDSVYTVVYRNAAYTVVMFFFPFAILTFVNLRIIGTLRSSYKMRRQMTMNPKKKRDSTVPSDAVTVFKTEETVITTLLKQPINGSTPAAGNSIERKENGVTVMLVAITTEFLIFNLLAFANNILELTGAYGHSQIETLLVEVSALLVNVNGASTIIIYIIFGTKYRNVFFHLVRKAVHRICGHRKSGYGSTPHYETTQLLDSRADDLRKWKSQRSRFEVSSDRQPLASSQRRTTFGPSSSPSGGNVDNLP